MSERRCSVAVFGPGLMGGSLLLALRERQPSWTLRAWARRPAALEELQSRKLADFCSTNEADVAEKADVIVLCVPVDKLADVARAAAPGIKAEGVVTDVGSVKSDVVAALEEIFNEHRNFVGSHPMCGSEAAGLEAARADLYDNAICAVTPTAETPAKATSVVRSLWESAGARVVEMTPQDHDRAAALASHVPHVAAAALVELVHAGPEAARQLCATGFRDTTRVADGTVSVWEPILMQNRKAVAQGLQELTEILQSIHRALENNDAPAIAAFLESARAGRRALLREQS